MTKARTRAEKRRAKKLHGMPELAPVDRKARGRARMAEIKQERTKAVRPTPERIAKGDIQIPRGAGAKGGPALVSVPDCVAALCIHPRRITQAQENAARYYQELRWRVRADLGLSEGRSCLDIGPVGHDEGEGDLALAAEWRKVRSRLGPRAIGVLDATVMEGRWPRDMKALRSALDAIEGC